MSKINDLVETLCPNGIKFKDLEKCCNILDNKRRPVTKSARTIGEYPYYGANGIQDYVSDYIFDGKYVLVGEDGSVINGKGNPIVTWAEGKIWVNNHAHIIEEIEGVSLRYLYHYIQTINVTSLIHGNIPKLNQGDFRKLQIAVPPMEVQDEIVRILDDFTLLSAELSTELSTELKARKKQFEYYREKLINENFEELVSLKELCEIKGRIGFRGYTRNDLVNEGEGAISFSPGNITNETITYDKCTYVSWEKYNESPEIMINNGDILLCKTGSTLGKVAMVEDLPEKATINPQLVVLKNLKCDSKYLKYVMGGYYFQNEMQSKKGLGSVPNISQKDIGNIVIKLHDTKTQIKIGTILSNLDRMFNDIFEVIPAEIEARQKQYEYYRDKLLTFKELVNEE